MSIQEKLEKKLEEYKSLQLADNHLKKLKGRIVQMHSKLDALYQKLEKENKDVEQLEKLSIRSMFEKILGDKEAQLEKERQEYLNAVLKYNELKSSLELLEFEKSVLEKKLEKLKETKSEVHNLIRQREQTLLKEDPLANQLIKDINEKIDKNISIKRELHEAINIGNRVNKVLLQISDNLFKVRAWGEFPLNKPDVHIKKMAHINRAKNQAYKAKQLLQQFEDELTDIYNDHNILIQSSLKTFRYFMNSFFDNLISDWIVILKIQNALHTLQQVNNKVIRITKSLHYDLKNSEKELELLQDKKEKIILEFNK